MAAWQALHEDRGLLSCHACDPATKPARTRLSDAGALIKVAAVPAFILLLKLLQKLSSAGSCLLSRRECAHALLAECQLLCSACWGSVSDDFALVLQRSGPEAQTSCGHHSAGHWQRHVMQPGGCPTWSPSSCLPLISLSVCVLTFVASPCKLHCQQASCLALH